MNVYNASIHVSIFQNFVCHICHFFHSSKAVQSHFAVDPLIAFRCSVFMPAGLNKTWSNGIY